MSRVSHCRYDAVVEKVTQCHPCRACRHSLVDTSGRTKCALKMTPKCTVVWSRHLHRRHFRHHHPTPSRPLRQCVAICRALKRHLSLPMLTCSFDSVAAENREEVARECRCMFPLYLREAAIGCMRSQETNLEQNARETLERVHTSA